MGNNLELAVPQIYREISIYKQRWCRKPNPSTWSLANSWVYTVFWGLLKCIYHISLQNYRYTKYIKIWANYNNSLTWIKAIWGWFPLLAMIPVRSQWGHYNLARYIYIYTHSYIYISTINPSFCSLRIQIIAQKTVLGVPDCLLACWFITNSRVTVMDWWL
jgi:hypothetical protein